jgi:RNA polymerase sigma-70 factor (ECF subfamily)
MNIHQAEFLKTRFSLLNRMKDLEDQDSWREFFEMYWGFIFGVALKSGLTPTEAEDVVQETILSVCKNIKQFKADPAHGSFKSWLLNLTRWRIKDQVRKRSAEVSVSACASGGSGTGSSTPLDHKVPDPAGNALEKIWDEEWQKNLIRAALEKLKAQVSGKHYQVFYLHVIKQEPPQKVADALNIPVDQVYLIKHRLSLLFEKAVKDLETELG